MSNHVFDDNEEVDYYCDWVSNNDPSEQPGEEMSQGGFSEDEDDADAKPVQNTVALNGRTTNPPDKPIPLDVREQEVIVVVDQLLKIGTVFAKASISLVTKPPEDIFNTATILALGSLDTIPYVAKMALQHPHFCSDNLKLADEIYKYPPFIDAITYLRGLNVNRASPSRINLDKTNTVIASILISVSIDHLTLAGLHDFIPDFLYGLSKASELIFTQVVDDEDD